MEKAENFIFYVDIVLYGKEMKLTSLHMNVRGQGHLFTFSKIIWVEKKIKHFFQEKNLNKFKWWNISYEANMGWKTVMIVKWS